MKRVSLKEDKLAYRTIIGFDCLVIIVTVALAFLIEPIFLLLSLPFIYDLYYVSVHKERTWVSYISELVSLIP